MIKDYRFHLDTGNGNPSKRIRTYIASSFLALGLGAAIYSALEHRTPANDALLSMQDAGTPTRESIELALPALSGSESGPETAEKTPLPTSTTEPTLTLQDSVTDNGVQSANSPRPKSIRISPRPHSQSMKMGKAPQRVRWRAIRASWNRVHR